MSTFNQGVPGVATLINSSATILSGNAASANALTVRQFGGGNVFSAQTTTGSTALFVSGSGNVGVGTTVTGSVLDVYTADAAYGIRHTTGTIAIASYIASGSTTAPAQFGTTTNHKLGFYTNNGGPSVILDTNGRLGINQASPQTLFHVTATASNSAIFIDNSLGSIGPRPLATNAGSANCHIWADGAANGSSDGGFLRIAAGGGAGTGNKSYIDLSGYSGTADMNQNIVFGTQGAERMRIRNDGNVGIGTTNPGSLLDISATGAVHSSTGTLRFYRSDVATWWKFVGPDTGNTLYLQPTNTSYGVYITALSTAWASASDARLKNIIEPISNALSKVDILNPVIYSWKTDETNKPHPGLIAQDVLKVQPEAVVANGEGMYGVQYTELIPLAFAAIKELSAENTALKAQLTTMDARLAALEKAVLSTGTAGS